MEKKAKLEVLAANFLGRYLHKIWVKSSYVWVKVWTKQTQKNAYLRRNLIHDKSAQMRHSRVQKRPEKRMFAKSLVLRQKRVFNSLKPGQWKKHIVSKTPGYARKTCLWQTMKTLFPMDVLSLWLREQSFTSLFYFKLTLLANDSDVWQMSVM